MVKPIVYNYEKAENRIKELEGIVIRLNIDNEYLRERIKELEEELKDKYQKKKHGS